MVLEPLIAAFKSLCAGFPDLRTGENTVYDMPDIGIAAFATFFMQSPSFLAQQTALARGRGTSNCQTLFQMVRIPTDNSIRALLDPVPPQLMFPMFSDLLAAFVAGGGLASFQRLGGHVLIALDGTEYFCSQKLSCPNCSSRARANGRTEHFHQMVSAAMVAPGHDRALPLAAGVIHTDFEKGFIRSETIAYADYVALKGEAGCRDAGKMRLEGKDYVVQDGDVLHFRFNT